MRFKTLRFKNFLSFGNNITEIDLNSNKTILITGENGSGKTSLMEALYFVISGKPYRDIKKSELINTTNKKELYVELEFEHNDHNYLVKRGIKPDIFELYKDDVLIDKDSATKDYQKMLEAIIGIDANTFGNTVFVSSKNYKPFMKLTAAEKRSFIENVLNIKIFSEILEQTKIKRTLHNEAHNTLIFNLKNNTDKLNIAIESNEKYAKNNEKEIIDINEKINTEKDKLTPVIDEINRINKYLENNKFNEKFDDVNSKIDEINNELDINIKKIDDDFKQDTNNLYNGINENNNHIQKLNTEIENYKLNNKIGNNDQINIINKANEKINQIINERKNKCQQEENNCNIQIEVNNKHIQKINQEIEFYTHNANCPMCKQEIDKDSEIIKDEIKTLENKKSLYNAEIESLDKKLKEKCLHYNEEEIKLVQKITQEKNDQLETLKIEMQKNQISISDNEKEINKLYLKVEELTEKLNNLNDDRLNKINGVKEIQLVKYNELLTEKTKFESQLKKADDRLNILLNVEKARIDTNISMMNERVDELNKMEKKELIETKMFEDEINKTKNEISESEYQKETIDQMIKMLGDKGLKSYIVKKYIPIINELTNKYLEIFSANYRITFDENFDLCIHSKGYEKLSYGSFSSGEEQRTDLALLFSFHQLGKIKSSLNTNLILLDEISDKSLDSDGLNGLFLIFENMKRAGQTIFNISHRPEVRDRFDIAYKVNKNRFSTIEEI